MSQSERRGRFCWYCNNSKDILKCIDCGYHVECILWIDGENAAPKICEYCGSLHCGHCIDIRDDSYICQCCLDNTDSPRTKCYRSTPEPTPRPAPEPY
jgi:hypothetical protein